MTAVPLPQPSRGGERIVILDLADAGKGTALALEAAKLAGAPVLLSRNLENDLAQAAAFVYLTRSEGLGSAVLLAMAAGVPVIVSNAGGLLEIVKHERTGWSRKIPPPKWPARSAACATTRQCARARQESPRRVRRAKFTVAQMVARTIAVYEKIS